jgi:hypothetical protein
MPSIQQNSIKVPSLIVMLVDAQKRLPLLDPQTAMFVEEREGSMRRSHNHLNWSVIPISLGSTIPGPLIIAVFAPGSTRPSICLPTQYLFQSKGTLSWFSLGIYASMGVDSSLSKYIPELPRAWFWWVSVVHYDSLVNLSKLEAYLQPYLPDIVKHILGASLPTRGYQDTSMGIYQLDREKGILPARSAPHHIWSGLIGTYEGCNLVQKHPQRC